MSEKKTVDGEGRFGDGRECRLCLSEAAAGAWEFIGS